MSGPAKTISILKMGFAEPEVQAEHGDFVDWIVEKLPGPLRGSVRVIDPLASLPEIEEVDTLIITGSSAMVTDPSASDLKAFRWLERALAAGVPTLGICYGHQMLGQVLGGKVGMLPGGPEIGLAEVKLSAGDDSLFKGCKEDQEVAVIHWQTVLELPLGAVVLGRGQRDPHQIVRFAPRVWGVQFHPEFGPGPMTHYVHACADELRSQGLNPEQMAQQTASWRDQTDVIKRFGELVS